MPVLGVDGHAMVPVPRIKNGFGLVRWHSRGNLPGALGVVGLSRAMIIDSFKINHPSRAPIRFRCYNHSANPACWGIDRDTLEDTKANVSLETSLDLCLPVLRYCSGAVYSHRLGMLIDKESEWWTVPHEGQWLVFAGIK